MGILRSKGNLIAVALAGAAGMGLLVMVYCVDPSASALFPQCMLHKLTGLHCAFCGATRAMHAFLHGHVGAAFRYNPLVAAVLPVLLVCWGAWRFWKFRRPQTGSPGVVPVWILLGLLLLFGVLRNVPIAPFNRLAPDDRQGSDMAELNVAGPNRSDMAFLSPESCLPGVACAVARAKPGTQNP